MSEVGKQQTRHQKAVWLALGTAILIPVALGLALWGADGWTVSWWVCPVVGIAAALVFVSRDWERRGVANPGSLVLCRWVSAVVVLVLCIAVHFPLQPNTIPVPLELYAAMDQYLIVLDPGYAEGQWLAHPDTVDLKTLREKLQSSEAESFANPYLRLKSKKKNATPDWAEWEGVAQKERRLSTFFSVRRKALERKFKSVGYVELAAVSKEVGEELKRVLDDVLPPYDSNGLELRKADLIGSVMNDGARATAATLHLQRTFWRAANQVWNEPGRDAEEDANAYIRKLHDLTQKTATDLADPVLAEADFDAKQVVTALFDALRSANGQYEQANKVSASRLLGLQKEISLDFVLRLPYLHGWKGRDALAADLVLYFARERLEEIDKCLTEYNLTDQVFMNLGAAEGACMGRKVPFLETGKGALKVETGLEALGLVDSAAFRTWLDRLGAKRAGGVCTFAPIDIGMLIERYVAQAQPGDAQLSGASYKNLQKFQETRQVHKALQAVVGPDGAFTPESWERLLREGMRNVTVGRRFQRVKELGAPGSNDLLILAGIRLSLAQNAAQDAFFDQIKPGLDEECCKAIVAWRGKVLRERLAKIKKLGIADLPAYRAGIERETAFNDLRKGKAGIEKQLAGAEDLLALLDLELQCYRYVAASELVRQLVVDNKLWEEEDIEDLGYSFKGLIPAVRALAVQRALLCSSMDVEHAVDEALAARIREGAAANLQPVKPESFALSEEWVIESVRQEARAMLAAHDLTWENYNALRPLVDVLIEEGIQKGKPAYDVLNYNLIKNKTYAGLLSKLIKTLPVCQAAGQTRFELGRGVKKAVGELASPDAKDIPAPTPIPVKTVQELVRFVRELGLHAGASPPRPGYSSMSLKEVGARGGIDGQTLAVLLGLGDAPVQWRAFLKRYRQATEPSAQ